MRAVFLSLIILMSFGVVLSQDCDKEEGMPRVGIFTDTGAFRKSKEINELNYENGKIELTLKRNGDAFLLGQLGNRPANSYRIAPECKWVTEQFFDVLAYSVVKFGLLNMPETIEGDVSDMGTFALKISFYDGKEIRTGFVGGSDLFPSTPALRIWSRFFLLKKRSGGPIWTKAHSIESIFL